MPSAKNKVVVASAGSRKTTMIVEEAIALVGKRILITTYTHENLDQIRSYLIEKCGHVPKHIVLLSWFSFLLQEGIRPYQSFVTEKSRIASILFKDMPSGTKYAPKNNLDRYYLANSGDIYRDRVSDFVCTCDERSGGLIVRRLEKAYDHIFIDEVQDLAGYDLTFLEKLFQSALPITAVGDPRQGTFSTNNSGKNKKFKRSGIFDWVLQHSGSGLITMEEKNDSFRCNQVICDFADVLFQDFNKTKSMNGTTTGHDGIFMIKKPEVPTYFESYKPVVLRWNKQSDTMNLPAFNIGASKGRNYDRVLIFPTGPMKAYLKSRNLDHVGDRSKLYVAVTRARYSVAFVI